MSALRSELWSLDSEERFSRRTSQVTTLSARRRTSARCFMCDGEYDAAGRLTRASRGIYLRQRGRARIEAIVFAIAIRARAASSSGGGQPRRRALFEARQPGALCPRCSSQRACCEARVCQCAVVESRQVSVSSSCRGSRRLYRFKRSFSNARSRFPSSNKAATLSSRLRVRAESSKYIAMRYSGVMTRRG